MDKELEAVIKNIIKEEIKGEYITTTLCDERVKRFMEKSGMLENNIEEMKRKIDRLYAIAITSILGIFSTFLAVILRLLKF